MRNLHTCAKLGVALFVMGAASWLPSGTSAQAPQGPPSTTFQVEVNYVDIDTIVTDENGNFVSNLSRDDFEVLEDGKPQKIDTFSYVEIPIERQVRFAALGRPVSPDVRSNRESFSGRIYVLVLDDYNVSPMRTSAVRRWAREFIERHLGANDLAAVVYTSGRSELAQDFTNDRQLLLASVDKFVGQKLRSAAVDELDAYYQDLLNRTHFGTMTDGQADKTAQATDLARTGTIRQYDQERSLRAHNVLRALSNLSEFLGGIRGRRKAVLYFSEGIDYPIRDLFGPNSAGPVLQDARDAIGTASRANVIFFPVDPRGLSGLTAEYLEVQGVGVAAPVGQGSAIGTSGPDLKTAMGPMTAPGVLLNELQASQETLRAFADETGGFATLNLNDPTATFQRIADHNSRYYVLGYYAPTHPRDGRFHRIEVRVRKPGLRVQARRGYASPRGQTAEERRQAQEARRDRDAKIQNATSKELRETLTRPVQQSGLTFTVQAAPFRSTQQQSSVALAIEFDPGKLTFTPHESQAAYSSRIELSMFGINEHGRPQPGIRSELVLNLRPSSYESAKTHGLRVNPRLELAPGRYQLRVAAREIATGHMGSVFYDLEVPDFRKGPLMLSGLLLSAASTDAIVTAQRDPVVATLLPGPATSTRVFPPTDIVTVYAEIYDNQSSRQPRNIDVELRLIAENGQSVFSARDTLSNGAQGSPPWSAYGYLKRIPLVDVPAGHYLVRVEARVSGIKESAAHSFREAVISVP
jgi:VWFA-related protein